jgi:AcrR family transcriptional regulator
MTPRGEATRTRLIAATQEVVRAHGYAGATTKAIAAAAGVSEGTIYRHFPDKVALFFAAVLDGDRTILEELGTLPDRAGEATVVENLTATLSRLSALRDQIIPLELALRADPELAAKRRSLPLPEADELAPPLVIARYLTAEQALGRVRADVDPFGAAVILLASLFGASLLPEQVEEHLGIDLVAESVALIVQGLRPD